MLPTLRITVALACAAATAAAAQAPSRDTLLSRLHAYLDRYEETLAAVVAEERYTQEVHDFRVRAPERSRVLLSDYSPARAAGGHAWTGFRDTFEIDGRPVRDREDRLAALLAEGSVSSAEQALRITRENARYNLGADLVTRTINVPTVALDLLHRRHRDRFDITREEGAVVAGRAAWRLRFRERGTPTILRTPQGGDRRSTLTAWIEADTGAVLRTTIGWDGVAPAGEIAVAYRDDANIGALVPDRMTEEYRSAEWVVAGEAVYTNYRRFQTGARILSIAPGR
jgi:hypothetical protein